MRENETSVLTWKKTHLILCALALTVFSFSATAKASIDIERKQAIERIATEILKGIEASQSVVSGSDIFDAASTYYSRIMAQVQKKKPRIAVWPFKKDEIPISKDLADELNAAVLAKLIQKSRGRYEFVARESLRNIISDMEATGALNRSGANPVAALMESAQDISILVSGRLSLKRKDLSVSYKAMRVDGAIVVAATDPEIIHLKRDERNTDRATLSLNQALTAAAKSLADDAHDMQELRLDGIRFETSGLQPDFGRFALDKLSSELQRAFANVVSERALKVQKARINFKEISGSRGISVDAKELLTISSSNGGVYLLSGTYWDLGDDLELRVSLRGNSGRMYSWSGRIRMDSVSALRIHPQSTFGDLRENDNLGPIGFTLTTNKGDDPSYKIGEKMDLAIRLSRDAWVYCFYQQADGNTIQIFPNPHFLNIYSEPKLEGRHVHIIPGETTFPFDLKFQPPLGEELLKCFAVSKNVTSQLPKALRGMSLSPLPQSLARKLAHTFRALPNASVSEASVVITVVE
ncbi:DUF4384 domain-containing protein [Magnetovibrio sp. PR-2]|uniref:DUF4384 domain-containing protein n=1 Tax=Magnetovibrio sp. PR-2 TaxID=3120356 RepID=UPI002FCE36DC